MENFNENLGNEPTERGDPSIVDAEPYFVGKNKPGSQLTAGRFVLRTFLSLDITRVWFQSFVDGDDRRVPLRFEPLPTQHVFP